ncbi:MAG: polysaccharide biosynthesis/export family protein [Phycisphaerales bacterium]|nr:MAG: polysaccharide biosynthesis/export family protein [Phycisphaerales bacterium]
MTVLLAGVLGTAGGCYSFLNSWLDPSQVGHYFNEGTLEIRTALSIQDSPTGIPGATEPTPEDLVPHHEAYRLLAGDALNVRIFELMAENTETNVQVTLDEEGMVSLPVLGRVRASGMTVGELEAELADILRQRDIMFDAQVIIDPLVKRGQSYTIFGSVQAPALYPVTRPDLRLMEAISVAGGLMETVTEIYVTRRIREEAESPLSAARAGRSPERALVDSGRAGISPPMSDGFSDAPPAATQRSEEREAEPEPASDTGLEALTPLHDVLDGPEADRELIESVIHRGPEPVVPAEQPAASAPAAEPAVVMEPPAQPRFIFLNGKWIEVQPPTTQPEPEALPSEEQQVPAPERVPREAETQPVIDWSQIAGETEQRIIRVSAEGLRNGDPRQDIVVRPGDSIRLMAGEFGEYYIMGQVVRPGAYSVTGRRLTLKQAIASAGNIAPLGWPDRCTVYRRYGDREEMKQVNLDAIFAGKEADLFVKRDDLIVVGTHPIAPFLAVIRNAFRMTYGFGFVYDRNFADVDAYTARPNPAYRQTEFPNLFQ